MLYNIKIVFIFVCEIFVDMKFVKVLDNGSLWAVKYDGEELDCFEATFKSWYDMSFLREFFKSNITDLQSYFKITDIDQAIYDTVEDASRLECLMLDISPNANLDYLFRHLENNRFSEMSLSREKAKGKGIGHASWLRIYAIKLDQGTYLITGGAIKLTATMGERQHTLNELIKMNKVRDYLLTSGIFDIDGLTEYDESN